MSEGASLSTPKWLKSKTRERMKQTGEKYTEALRAVKAEVGYDEQTGCSSERDDRETGGG